MNSLNTKRIFEELSDEIIGGSVDLLPGIKTQVERQHAMRIKQEKNLLLSFGFIILTAVAILISVPGSVTAMKRLLGLIPGTGMVEKGSNIRILAEPVSVTREGITLTVMEATLVADRTVIVYRVEGIPDEAHPTGESAFTCQPSTPSLRMPDGSELAILQGEGKMVVNGYEDKMVFPPISTSINEVEFKLPCLVDVSPGAAPQDWQLTLNFIPAPPDFKILDVVELATPLPPEPKPVVTVLAESEAFMDVTYQLNSVQQTERGYILETSINWSGDVYPDSGVGTGADVTLRDVNGREIPVVNLASTMVQKADSARQTVLRYSVEGAVDGPATLTLPWVGANITAEKQAKFVFDPGKNPTPGQTWTINQTIQVLGQPVKIVSARFVQHEDLAGYDWMRFMPEELYGFEFTLETEPVFRKLWLSVESGYSQNGHGTSGSPVERDEHGQIKSFALMSGEITGPLTIAVVVADIEHAWEVTWPIEPDLNLETPQLQENLLLDVQIEQVIPAEDGYYLIGRTTWKDERIASVNSGGWDTRLLDKNGTEIPIEPAQFDSIGITDVQPGQWLLKVFGTALPADLTLQFTQVNVEFTQPYTFDFELGELSKFGQEWELNVPLEILSQPVTLQKAVYVGQGEMHGFAFDFLSNGNITRLFTTIEKGVDGDNGMGGGSMLRDAQNIIRTHSLTNGQFNGEPLEISIRTATINGVWTTVWNPPVITDSQPSGLQACVQTEEWLAAAASADRALIPAGLPEQLILTRGAIAPDPSIFAVNLDGFGEIPVAFGEPVNYSRETGLTYIGADSQGYVVDLTNGLTTLAGGVVVRPDQKNIVRISPDGLWKAYTAHVPGRFTDGIYVSRVDGSDASLVVQLDTVYARPADWSPDGKWLLFSVYDDSDLLNPRKTVGLVNMETCEVVALPWLDGMARFWVN